MNPLLQPASSKRVRIANLALQGAWARRWASRPILEPDLLIRKAALKAKADPDADDCGWRSRLTLLCGDLTHQAQLTSLGLVLAQGQLVSALAARFRAHALWQQYPEIAEQQIRAPIIVIGQMRSGTTRMQRLLACDPRFTFTRFYESWNPIPEHWPGPDGRKLKGRIGLTCARLLNPHFDAIHPTSLHAPEEEIGLHNLSIFGAAFEAQWRVPNYTAAVETEDCTGVYQEFKRLLQTLTWLRGDGYDRPWVLKVPQFSQDVVTMLKIFPDARLVYMRRDPREVIASSTSLVCNQRSLQSHQVDRNQIGNEWARKIQLRQDRMAAARATARVPQIEVDYNDMSKDWAHEIRRVYTMLGLPLEEAAHMAMRKYAAATAPARRKVHKYDAIQFGMASAPSSYGS